MPQPGLILWQHGEYAYSTDGTPDWGGSGSSGDLLVNTGRFKPDLNQLLKCRCHHLLVGYIPEGEVIQVTATSYPGTPNKRWTVKPWVGKYITVKIAVIVTVPSGAGKVYALAQFEGPVGTTASITTYQTSSTSLVQLNATFDISNVSGNDRRGEEGFLNLFLKVDTGVTAEVRGMCAFQLEDVASNTYTLD